MVKGCEDVWEVPGSSPNGTKIYTSKKDEGYSKFNEEI